MSSTQFNFNFNTECPILRFHVITSSWRHFSHHTDASTSLKPPVGHISVIPLSHFSHRHISVTVTFQYAHHHISHRISQLFTVFGHTFRRCRPHRLFHPERWYLKLSMGGGKVRAPNRNLHEIPLVIHNRWT